MPKCDIRLCYHRLWICFDVLPVWVRERGTASRFGGMLNPFSSESMPCLQHKLQPNFKFHLPLLVKRYLTTGKIILSKLRFGLFFSNDICFPLWKALEESSSTELLYILSCLRADHWSPRVAAAFAAVSLSVVPQSAHWNFSIPTGKKVNWKRQSPEPPSPVMLQWVRGEEKCENS